jgi:phosphoribosylanthranilate isomerase
MVSRVRVKVCGITNEADAGQAALLGADAIGLNFYPQSPRHVSEEVAGSILRTLPPFVEPVGVFVNEPLKKIFPLLAQLGRIRSIQMHGIQREICDAFPFHFIPAFQVKDRQDLVGIERYLNTCRGLGRMPSAILVDGHAPGLHGGTGRNPPWELLRDVRWEVPLILAGGLTPDNVGEAVRAVRPYAVDVASGVESEPGRKDIEKMKRFIENVRNATLV